MRARRKLLTLFQKLRLSRTVTFIQCYSTTDDKSQNKQKTCDFSPFCLNLRSSFTTGQSAELQRIRISYFQKSVVVLITLIYEFKLFLAKGLLLFCARGGAF